MAKRIPWSKHEIALLFMAYENVVNGSSMKEQAFWLSDNLRRLASINGIVIDGTFRNINGMNMQLGNVQFLFTGGEKQEYEVKLQAMEKEAIWGIKSNSQYV